MPQIWNRTITSSYYSQKQTTKGVKFPLQISAGSDHISLKRCYQTIIIWYAKLALIGRKFFTEYGYDNSHSTNRYQTYQSHHANGNQSRKLSLNMMIYTTEHRSVNMTSQYLTAVTIDWQNIVHPNLPYDPSKQLTKWETLREPYEKTPQKFFLSHIDRMMNGT